MIPVLFIGGPADGRKEWLHDRKIPALRRLECEPESHLYSLTVFAGGRYGYVHETLNPDTALAKLFDAYQPMDCAKYGHRFGVLDIDRTGRTRWNPAEACERCGALK